MINTPYEETTQASRTLYDLACQVVQQCPSELGEEIALMGSAGWGVADEYSDLDLMAWVETLPPLEAIENWLEQIGAIDIQPDNEVSETKTSVICQFKGVWLEVSICTLADQEKTLEAILAGETIERHRIIHAWNIVRATPLCTQGFLAGWQRKLSHYPDVVQERLIAESSSFWRFPHRVEMLWTLASRGALLGLDQWLFADLQDALRILFAMNCQWEPDWKNIQVASRLLGQTPDRLVERLNEIFLTAQPEKRVALAQRLILDILEFVPPRYDVSEAVTNIRASLQAHAVLSG